MHTEKGGKMLCSYCGRSYETMTSYKAHYKNNLCIKVIVPGMIEDVEDPESEAVDEDTDTEDEDEEGATGGEFAP